ncbi:MAG: hypothetical protein U9N43_04835 [Euryarchaeota archaeon]|nr:hypothetical protein [Euryarchaeota archaeon]
MHIKEHINEVKPLAMKGEMKEREARLEKVENELEKMVVYQYTIVYHSMRYNCGHPKNNRKKPKNIINYR